MAWEKLGSANVSGSVTNTSYKELGRATLSSDGDSLDVGSITSKDNMMIISYVKEDSGSLHASLRFNNDSGNSYAHRSSTNGGNDWTSASQNKLRYGAGTSNTQQFNVATLNNISAQEKLMNSSMAYTQDGTIYREETVGKWANTSAQINDVELLNTQSGSFDSGGEIVVLGFDNDEADEGSNFWQELTTTEATSNQSGTWSTDTFTSKKYLWIQTYFTGTNSDPILRLGTGGSIDTGSNYAYRFNYNNGGDQTGTSNGMAIGSTAGGSGFNNTFIINNSATPKLVINENNRADSTGAGNEPDYRFEGVGRWSNTSGQIDKIAWYKSSGTIAGTGSYIKVWGAN